MVENKLLLEEVGIQVSVFEMFDVILLEKIYYFVMRLQLGVSSELVSYFKDWEEIMTKGQQQHLNNSLFKY